MSVRLVFYDTLDPSLRWDDGSCFGTADIPAESTLRWDDGFCFSTADIMAGVALDALIGQARQKTPQVATGLYSPGEFLDR